MSLHQKTFVASGSTHDAEQLFAELDRAFENFVADQHWSQARDSFQSIAVVGENKIVIARTFVYTDEAVATGMPARTARPPV